MIPVFYADPQKRVLYDTKATLCGRIVQLVHNPAVILLGPAR
jgi:hypothetical protein